MPTTAAIIGEFVIGSIDFNSAVLTTPFGYEIKGVLSPSATRFEFEFGRAVPPVVATVANQNKGSLIATQFEIEKRKREREIEIL